MSQRARYWFSNRVNFKRYNQDIYLKKWYNLDLGLEIKCPMHHVDNIPYDPVGGLPPELVDFVAEQPAMSIQEFSPPSRDYHALLKQSQVKKHLHKLLAIRTRMLLS